MKTVITELFLRNRCTQLPNAIQPFHSCSFHEKEQGYFTLSFLNDFPYDVSLENFVLDRLIIP